MKSSLLLAPLAFFALSFANGQSNQNELHPKYATPETSFAFETGPAVHSLSDAGDIIWSDDFSDPSTWEMNNTSVPQVDWIITTDVNIAPASSGFVPLGFSGAANGFAFVEGDGAGDGSVQNANLTTTAPIDCSGYPFITLAFEQATRNWQTTYTVSFSTDGGLSWINRQINQDLGNNMNSANPGFVSVDVSEIIGNAPSVLIRFNYQANWGWFWAIDNVQLLAFEAPPLLAGTLSISASSLLAYRCIGDGIDDNLTFTVTENTYAGNFVLVRGNTLNILDMNTTGAFDLGAFGQGAFRVAHIAVGDLSQLEGITHVSQIQGDFAVSNTLNIFVAELNGGTISTTDPTILCEGQIAVNVEGAGQDFKSRFGLTLTGSKQPLLSNETGVFDVTDLPAGSYRIVHVHFRSFSDLNSSILPFNSLVCVSASNAIEIEKTDCAGDGAQLHSFPNPTEGSAQVSFTAPEAALTTLEVYDMSGRRVAELFRQMPQTDMNYTLHFDGSALPNGIYVYVLRNGSHVINEKFVLAR